MRAGPQRNRARKGSVVALLGALTLAMISGALLDARSASAAPAGFYGASLRGLVATDTPAATATDTPVATATDTPAATATDTPAATNTPTPAPTATPRPTPTTTATHKVYLNITAALNATHQQRSGSNLCGVATITLIANYLYPYSNTTQLGVAGMINATSSTSEWGAPTPAYVSGFGWRPGFTADIAYDFGTDPRSIAYGLTATTGWQYHAKVDTASAWDATIHIVDDMINTQQPISVIVDHGLHSVVVYGVKTRYSTDNPVTNPSSITDIYVWDPAGGDITTGIQSSPTMEVPISLWLSGVIPWSGETYFKYPYSSNPYDVNGTWISLDPDPIVGPYTYLASKKNHLWNGHWVWLSASGGAGLNADWELNQYGALIRGLDGSGFPATPAGYAGPSVPMPNDLPPPPPPVRHVYIVALPKPHPKPVPKPTPTPRPTATATPPRWRSSPTPDLPWPTQPPASDPPPAQRVCLSSFCLPDAQSSTWLMALAGLLLLAALLSGGLMALRRRPALAGVAPAATPDAAPDATLAALSTGEAAPPPVGLMWLADEAPTTPAEAAEPLAAPPDEEAPLAEEAAPDTEAKPLAEPVEPLAEPPAAEEPSAEVVTPATETTEPPADETAEPLAEEPGPIIVPLLEAAAPPPPADEAPQEG